MACEDESPRIEEIEVTGLFGWLNHRIALHTDERMTILHGPNGVGKTTLLRMIAALFSGDFTVFQRTHFSSMTLVLTNGCELRITRSAKKERTDVQLALRRGSGPWSKQRITPASPLRTEFPLGVIDDLIPHLDRIGPQKWLDNSSGTVLSLEEVIMAYADRLPGVVGVPDVREEFAEVLHSIEVSFIEAQRLLIPNTVRNTHRRPQPVLKPTVEQDAKDMAERLQDVLRRSGSVAASLDRTFPARLLRENLPPEATENRIREMYDLQKQYRNRLMEAGLLDLEELVDLPCESLDEAEIRVLWHYLNDVERKLEVYDDLLGRVELFMNIINSKGFLRKKLVIDKDAGFRFAFQGPSEIKEGKLALSDLSSGEQHEVVLVYHLLFKSKPNSLILVDEPELSLHVTWQHSFLDDMERVSQLAGLDFVVATHSPAIVRKRRSLMVALYAEDLE